MHKLTIEDAEGNDLSDSQQTAFISGLLKLLHAKPTHENVSLLKAWIRSETDISGRLPHAKYNPLNTKWILPGSTNFNGAGVKNYKNLKQGVEATWKTLDQSYGYFKAIQQYLVKQNMPVPAFLKSYHTVFKKWGTDPVLIVQCLKEYPKGALADTVEQIQVDVL